MPDSEIDATIDAAALLSRVGRFATQRLAELLEPTELSPRRMQAMVALRGGPLSQNILAQQVGVHPVKLVSILNDLEAAALIARRRDAADRRRHTVSLSELGRARLAAVDIAREKLDATLFKNVTAAQRATLSALLHQLAQNLHAATPRP